MSCRFIQLECSLGEWGWAYFACQIDREYSKFIYNFDNVEKKQYITSRSTGARQKTVAQDDDILLISLNREL